MVQYGYDAWGNVKTEVIDEAHACIAELNPFRYRSYYLDIETNLYYLQTRYYDPEIGRFISQDDVSYLNPETINGLNLFAYCGNNPVMRVDPSGTEWWDWIISALQIVVGAALVFTGLGAGFGASLFVGGIIGVTCNALGSTIGGGISSMMNGWGAISTGFSMCSFGIGGIIAGAALIIIGGATVLMGANEVAYGITGSNHLRDWMGDDLYGSLYLGLNIASAVGTIAGRLGMRLAATSNGKVTWRAQPYARITDGQKTTYYNGDGKMSWSIHRTTHGRQWHTNPHWHIESSFWNAEFTHSGNMNNFWEFILKTILFFL